MSWRTYGTALLAPRLAYDRDLARDGEAPCRGEIGGTWRQRRSGATLTITITPFRRLAAADRRAAEAEARDIAQLPGAERTTVDVTG